MKENLLLNCYFQKFFKEESSEKTHPHLQTLIEESIKQNKKIMKDE